MIHFMQKTLKKTILKNKKSLFGVLNKSKHFIF